MEPTAAPAPAVTPAVIMPTVGRRVWYWPSLNDLGQGVPNMVHTDAAQPLDAGICYVWNDRLVNLTVADQNGHMHRRFSVRLLQAGEQPMIGEAYAQWMPFQAQRPSADAQQGMALLAELKALLDEMPGDLKTLNAELAELRQDLTKLQSPGESISGEISQTIKVPDAAPTITLEDVETSIISCDYFTAQDGFNGSNFLPGRAPSASLRLLTLCVLTLDNGFTVLGESACTSPENFDAEVGQRIARADAVRKVWPLLGFALKTKLADCLKP